MGYSVLSHISALEKSMVKKEAYREKYIFVHDSLLVWYIHESYWKYIPWNQRKQYVYIKSVPQSSPIKKSV